MSKRSWKVMRAPKKEYGPSFYIEVEDSQGVVADVYDLDFDAGVSAARLIAAAPDMLDELKSILEVLEARKIGLHRQETIRQVIAKATH